MATSFPTSLDGLTNPAWATYRQQLRDFPTT
jgi:hypothetical protein